MKNVGSLVAVYTQKSAFINEKTLVAFSYPKIIS